VAETAVKALQLGKGPGTDFLGVSFSTLDLIGHAYGPSSLEIQDELARLDGTIGQFLA
jgi:predicted AlkP superfamily pyrophosphatase or phosphodiesterase